MHHGHLGLHWAKAVLTAETLTTETDHREILNKSPKENSTDDIDFNVMKLEFKDHIGKQTNK